jgi:hypothetical protein
MVWLGSHTPPHCRHPASGWPEGRASVGASPQPSSAVPHAAHGPGAGIPSSIASAKPQSQQKLDVRDCAAPQPEQRMV